MSAIDWMITAYAGFFCGTWIYFYLSVTRAVLSIPLFEKQNPPEPDQWPTLSIIVAACNEADTISSALSTLRLLEYPHLEIILVNDRSTDQTGDMIEDVARQDERIQTVHIDHLPERWLGKVYAMHRGTQKSRGDWILYTDADVHFRPGTLRKAVALAMAYQIDHLALMPVPRPRSFWLDVVIRAFGMMLIHSMKTADVGKPGSNAYVGIGAFNMVKRSALNRTEGIPWLRMEVADDMGLGLLLLRSKAKSRVLASIEAVSLHWYGSMRDMFGGLEKNLFGPGAHYNFARLVLLVVLLWAFVLAPFVAVLYSKMFHLWILGFVALIGFVISAWVAKNRFSQRLLPSFLIPAGQIIISLMMLRSGIMCQLRGGIVWRGTKYPLEDLRTGQRVKIYLGPRQV